MLYHQQAPTITTTAATPQDSPNTTLDANGFRDLGNRIPPSLALLGSTLSIDSIDRSMVRADTNLKPTAETNKNIYYGSLTHSVHKFMCTHTYMYSDVHK